MKGFTYIQESFGKQDILTVVNPNLIKEADFEIERINQFNGA